MCTSSCQCDGRGTQRCIEDSQTCICRFGHTGPDCSECAEGFSLKDDGTCVKASLCAELGGTETCQGHGECVQIGDTARCDCDVGFAHDGLIQCGRCSDPIMVYPEECGLTRKWVLQPTDIECEHLPYQMPRNLSSSEQVTQISGFLQWQGRYNLRS